MVNRSIRAVVGVTVFAIMTQVASAQTVYPRDGFIEHIKFLRDGVEVKLTPAGLSSGLSRANADLLALRVRNWHSSIHRMSSAINYRKLGFQIQIHCLAYKAGKLPKIGNRIKRHANPVNVLWSEIL